MKITGTNTRFFTSKGTNSGTKLEIDSPLEREESLPYQDSFFKEVMVAESPSMILQVEDLGRTLSEAYRVLEPGGKIRIDATVPLAPVNSDGGRSLALHWYNEIPISRKKTPVLDDLTHRFEEAGFERTAIMEHNPNPSSFYQKVIVLAVKPGSKEN